MQQPVSLCQHGFFSILLPLGKDLGTFASVETDFNLADHSLEINQSVDDVVRAGVDKFETRILQARCTFALWQCAPILFRETDHISGLRYPNGPGSGIQCFFNIADRVANFDYSLERIDFHANGVFINHPRKRTSSPDIVRTYSAIRDVTLPCGMGKKHIQHRPCVTGCAANLQPMMAQTFDDVGYSGNHRRAFGETGNLLGDEIGEQRLYFVLSRSLPVTILPRVSNAGNGEKRSDVILLKNSHVTTSFLFGDLNF